MYYYCCVELVFDLLLFDLGCYGIYCFGSSFIMVDVFEEDEEDDGVLKDKVKSIDGWFDVD